MSISPLSIFYFLSFFGKAFFSKEMVSVQWVLVGYSLAFSSDIAGFVGGLGFFGLNGVGMDCHGTIPHLELARGAEKIRELFLSFYS